MNIISSDIISTVGILILIIVISISPSALRGRPLALANSVYFVFVLYSSVLLVKYCICMFMCVLCWLAASTRELPSVGLRSSQPVSVEVATNTTHTIEPVVTYNPHSLGPP